MTSDNEEVFAKNPKQEPNRHFFVDGIVAASDLKPYVVFSNEHGTIAQIDMAQARQIAADILQMAARTEADAMVLKFFSATRMPPNAGGQMMSQFRDFRAELDEGDPDPTYKPTRG